MIETLTLCQYVPSDWTLSEQTLTDTPQYMHQGAPQGPPTPRSCANSDSGQLSRSRQTTGSATSPKPRARQARRKKAKTGKDKPPIPKLTAPLSELTKDYVNIPVKNMEEW